MIPFEKFTLSNGLRVIHQFDPTSTLACVNILYDVGAKHEDENKTGFAHLFEHLMFGGSKNIPNFDLALQKAGGYNNAYTTNDLTNYYDIVPYNNIETVFWIESDRMLELAFTPESLEVQKQVVIEEYKQSYLNRPYGDVWLLLHPFIYEKHPYRWPTIGKDIEHIKKAELQDVKDFFYKFYRPSNAILCVSGNVTREKIEHLCKKWFESIPSGNKPALNLPKEPEQKEKKFMAVERDVPASRLYKAWKIQGLHYENYRVFSVIAHVLSGGESSRLEQTLVKEKKLFTSISAYTFNLADDPSLFIISGTLTEKTSPEEAEKEINTVLAEICEKPLPEKELQKNKNKILTQLAFTNYNVEERAEGLCFYEWLGILDEYNREPELYESINASQIMEEAQKIFREEKSCVMYYLSKN
ncbi:MAG: insulinase family protein [Bacteroidia bacterium]|nr:insulinase family protein [Bacteroidia bacterium]